MTVDSPPETARSDARQAEIRQTETVPDSDKSPQQLEREIEHTRARLDGTIDAIQERLSPGQLMDQAMRYMREGGAGTFVNTLGNTIRNHPMPVALIGAGALWLAVSGGSRKSRSAQGGRDIVREYGGPQATYPDEHAREGYPREGYGRESYPREYGREEEYRGGRRVHPEGYATAGYGEGDYAGGEPRAYYGREGSDAGEVVTPGGPGGPGGYEQRGGGIGARARQAAERTRESMEHGAARARETGGGMGHRLRERAGHAAEGVRSRLSSAGEAVRGMAHRGGDGHDAGESGRGRLSQFGQSVGRSGESMMHMINEQPLIAAAVGVAVGVALGAALPLSRRESETMGGAREDVIHRAKAGIEEAVDRAKTAASAAADAASEEARSEGLSREGAKDYMRTAVEKAERVVKAATDAAREEVRGESHHGEAEREGSRRQGSI